MDLAGNSTLLGQSETGEDERIAARLFKLAQLMDTYYTPLLCLFGVIGNGLSLLVFCNDAKCRSQSAPYYLSALAISDTGFLLNLFAVWLEGVYGGVITSKLMCPLVMYLGQVTCFISVYLVVAFSVERYVAVHYPFSRPRICTRSKAKKVIALLIAVALLLFSYVWVIAQVIELDLEDYEEDSSINVTNEDGFLPEKSASNMKLLHDENRNFNPISAQTKNPDTLQVFKKKNFSHYEYDELGIGRFSSSFDFHHHQSHGSSSESQNTPTEMLLNNRSFLPWDPSLPHHHHSQQLLCTVPEKYYRISEIANYFDSVVTLVIPFTLITYFNLKIVTCIWKINNQREKIVVRASFKSDGGMSRSNSSSRNGGLNDFEMSCSNSNSDTATTRRGSTSVVTFHCSTTTDNNLHLQDSRYETKMLSAAAASTGAERRERDKQKRRMNKESRNSKKESYIKYKKCYGQTQQQSYAMVVLPPPPNDKLDSGERTSEEDIPIYQTSPISSKNRLKLSTVQGRGLERPHQHLHHRFSSSSSETRVTKTLLLISCMFLVLNLPAHMLRCAQFVQSLTGTQEGKEIILAALPWTNILFNTNFAVNFLLYCASGRNFRKSLVNLALKVIRKRHRPSPSPSTPFQNSSSKKGKKNNRLANIKINLTTTKSSRNQNNSLHSSMAHEGASRSGSIAPLPDDAMALESIMIDAAAAAAAGEGSSLYSTYIGNGNEIRVSV